MAWLKKKQEAVTVEDSTEVSQKTKKRTTI